MPEYAVLIVRVDAAQLCSVLGSAGARYSSATMKSKPHMNASLRFRKATLLQPPDEARASRIAATREEQSADHVGVAESPPLSMSSSLSPSKSGTGLSAALGTSCARLQLAGGRGTLANKVGNSGSATSRLCGCVMQLQCNYNTKR